MYLQQQVVDKSRACSQQQGEAPGRSHSAGEVVGRDSPEEQVEVGHSHSSYQVKGNRRQQLHSAPERHEKLEHRKNKSDFPKTPEDRVICIVMSFISIKRLIFKVFVFLLQLYHVFNIVGLLLW